MKITQDFFINKNTLEIAEKLIGKVLVYETNEGILKGIINETEAYTQEDPASHSYMGKITQRNKTMFKRYGHLYVYFTYGMYHCINIVTEKENIGSAVLVRSLIPIEGKEIMIKNRKGNIKNLTNGPGKISLAFNFNKELNGTDLLKPNSKIYLLDENCKPKNIKKTERIGISKGKKYLWRFVGTF